MQTPFNFRLHRLLKPSLLLAGGGGLLALIVLGGVVVTGQRLWHFVQGISKWAQITTQPATVEISTLIVQEVRAVSELTTTVFAMETVVPASQTRQWGDWVIGKTDLLYVSYGEVRAGIDLSQLSTEALTKKGDNLTLVLPAPQILDQKIDVNQSRIYDYDRGFLNLGPDTVPELQAQAQRQSLDKIVAAACERGILSEANERATLALQALLSRPGLLSIKIETTPPQTCGGRPIPASVSS